ncbi:hypothetical protein GE061_014763 [Apolygus lucorum]|uniref:Uncharacterized protein n=1 Tax=Apolygus lucorum TaxID=248454 RepID=A0A6A4JJ91_APOLU|nr:hypothetical protein GE061_014763 [Apolygus lucorum]
MTYPVSVKLLDNPNQQLQENEIQRILNANARFIELITSCDPNEHWERRRRLLYFLKKNLDFLYKAARGELQLPCPEIKNSTSKQ